MWREVGHEMKGEWDWVPTEGRIGKDLGLTPSGPFGFYLASSVLFSECVVNVAPISYAFYYAISV